MTVLPVITVVAFVLICGCLVHVVADQIATYRHSDMPPVISPLEKRLWMAGAAGGALFIALELVFNNGSIFITS